MQLNLKIRSGVALVIALVTALVLILVFDGGSGVQVHIERNKPAVTQSDKSVKDSTRGGAEKAEPRLRVAQRRAKEYWGRVACHNQIKYSIGKLPRGQWGYASWTDKGGRYTDCQIIFQVRVFGRGKNAPFPKFCQVEVHEYGHLLAEVHSHDRADVMYPVASWRNTPVECKRDQDNADIPPYTGGTQ